LEEEVERLRQEKEQLDQERAGALEAERQANEARELVGRSHFAAFVYTTFLLSALY